MTHEQFEATAEAALTQISVSAGAKSLSPRRRPTLSSRIPKFSKPTWVLIATGLFVAMILGGLAFSILKIKTPNGTIVIENLPKDAEVLVDGDTVDISWDNGKANVVAKPGERKVEVKQGNTTIEGETVTVRSSTEIAFKVSVEDLDESDQKLEGARRSEEISSALPLQLVLNPGCEMDLKNDGIPHWESRSGN